MVLTEAAGRYLIRMLDEAKAPRGTAIRIVQEAEALKPRLDRTRPGDQVYDHEGRRVLVLDPAVSGILQASQLDVDQTEQGPKLIILH